MEALARGPQGNAVLRPSRARDARLDLAQVKLERVAVARVGRALVVPQPLLARIGLDQLDALRRAPGEAQVAQRLRVDREDRGGRAELRRHVADRRAVGQRQAGETGAEELDDPPDDALRTQHLGHGEDEVGRRRPLRQPSHQTEADHLGQEHRHRLAEHRRLGLDAAHAPAEHAEPVDHRGVRIGAHERVGVGERQCSLALGDEDDTRQVLEVDLVHDAGVGRHDGEAFERVLPPAQERIALGVALELAGRVAGEGVTRAVHVDLDRVVDHQLGRHERIDPARRAAQRHDRVAHRRQIDDGGNAGEVLEQNARRREGDLDARLGRCVPAGERLHVGGGDGAVALGAQEVLQQDLERERQARDVEAGGERIEPEDLEAASPDLELGARIEAVGGHD